MAYTVMFQGTSSHVGKSVLTLALGRIFSQDGFRTAPFKAQNMALNSYVTLDGGEIGRSQVAQAEACGLEPLVEMNPVLLKPSSDSKSQVVLLGKPVGHWEAAAYHRERNRLVWEKVVEAYRKLDREYDILVIEGAGSPAEVNLKATDIANMRTAFLANAPVLLVADIDRGGALAAVVGTLELLDPEEKAQVKGIIINKFRGDVNLLRPALAYLEEKTSIPVLGVIPYLAKLILPEEDSVSLEKTRVPGQADINIGVIYYPRISNFTDFEVLSYEPDVAVHYLKEPEDYQPEIDLLVLPGSKNTVADLAHLRKLGFDRIINAHVRGGKPVLGICAGLQMLGDRITDPRQVESDMQEDAGLELLDTVTEYRDDKETVRTRLIVQQPDGFFFTEPETVEGYEIHQGRTALTGQATQVLDAAEKPLFFARGKVLGTYLHGIFDNDKFRHRLLNALRGIKGLPPLPDRPVSLRKLREQNYDLIAQVVRDNLDMGRIYQMMGMRGR